MEVGRKGAHRISGNPREVGIRVESLSMPRALVFHTCATEAVRTGRSFGRIVIKRAYYQSKGHDGVFSSR